MTLRIAASVCDCCHESRTAVSLCGWVGWMGACVAGGEKGGGTCDINQRSTRILLSKEQGCPGQIESQLQAVPVTASPMRTCERAGDPGRRAKLQHTVAVTSVQGRGQWQSHSVRGTHPAPFFHTSQLETPYNEGSTGTFKLTLSSFLCSNSGMVPT